MGFRETPFEDLGDAVWVLGVVGLVLYGGVLAVGARWGAEGAVTSEDWIGLVSLSVTWLAGGTVLAYLLQRDVVDDLTIDDGGVVTGVSAIEGQIAPGSGTVLAPVVDDRNVALEDHDESTRAFEGVVPGWEAHERTAPPEDAPVRWYDITARELYHGVGDKLTRSRDHVGSETRSADPLLVDAGRETVDLSEADLSFPQGEYLRVRSKELTIEDGGIAVSGLDAALTEAEPAGPRRGPTPTEGDSPAPRLAVRDGRGDGDRHDTVTGAFLERQLSEDETDPLVHFGRGDYEIDGRAWPAAAGERVYVLGEFERLDDGRLVPEGGVVVGRGQFTERRAEERARLRRWRWRAAVAAVVLLGLQFWPIPL